MNLFQTRKSKQAAFFIIALLIILSTIIKIPNTIKIVGQVVPARELIIKHDQDDFLTEAYIDNFNLNSISTKIFSFERGDIISVELKPNLSIGTQIQKGDTLGIIESNILQSRRAELLGDIIAAEENLKIYLSGENVPIIEEAQQRYDQALVKFENQKNVYDRNRTLYSDSLISQEEFELQESLYKISETDVNIAIAQLEAVSQGAKSEIIEYQKQIIENLKIQYEIIENQIKSGILISPMDGLVSFIPSQDTLLAIKSANDHLFISAIPYKHLRYLSENQNVVIKFPKTDILIDKIQIMNNDIVTIDGRPVIYIMALISDNKDLINGQIINANLNFGNQSVANLLLNIFN